VLHRPFDATTGFDTEELHTEGQVAVLPAGHPLTAVLADLHQQDLVTVVPVPGLDQSEVAAMLEGRAMLAAEVHQCTAGNPFFVHQLIRHLAETGSDDLAGAGVPAGVHWVVRRRLALLGTGTWRSLTVAAVIGPRFGAGLVGRVTGLGEQAALEALEGACAARLVTELPGGGFAFIHDLVREAIYAQLGTNRRALLHQAIADSLEALARMAVRQDCGPAGAEQAADR